jgi:PKD domain
MIRIAGIAPKAHLPGRLRILSALAALALPLAVANSASAGSVPRHQVLPGIDTGYLYGQLYDIATNYVYRVSGADGPPTDPSSPYNVPPVVNGWQELYAHWKSELTSVRAMGFVARYATAADHYFRRSGGYRFDSDDAEVTIPGASCPGERVLLASHPDNVPVPSSVAANIDSGNVTGPESFGTARRQITLSNLGNGGAYDDSSGLAMTMAEYQALLRWYAANGTLPARTLKITLLDAHAGQPLTPADEGAVYYAANLIPAGPQGQVVLFANMDMNGLEYPAFHWGTQHYLNDITNGGVGPWFTNIAASPLAPNSVYPDSGPGSPWADIAANLPAVQAFRANLQAAVTRAFGVLGQKYGFSVPLENPLRYDLPGNSPYPAVPAPQVEPAYTPENQAQFSPVRDDVVGRFDQVAFLAKGIPGYDVYGAYDSTGDDNPYPAAAASKPTILQYTGYDTTFQIGDGTPTAAGEGNPLGYTGDTIDHLNYWASGNVHGPGGVTAPSQELIRALELPSTWSAYLLAGDSYAGAVPRGNQPIAYFETSPVNPAGTRTITFDASFSRTAGGGTQGLKYFWDFGDGTTAYGGPRITHTYQSAQNADVKLAVIDGSRAGVYRQEVAVGVSGASSVPSTPACGTLSGAERAALLRNAEGR